MSESTIRRFLFENLNIRGALVHLGDVWQQMQVDRNYQPTVAQSVSYTHLRAHETVLDLVCRLLLEKNNTYNTH